MGSVGAHSGHGNAYAGEISATEAWSRLKNDPHCVLIDVRTPPEWAFSGEPDLSELSREPLKISWKIFPTYAVNEHFVAALKEAGIKADAALLFLCRTGGRSLDAAIFATAHGFGRCYNITDGFEGPSDRHHRRGNLAGWKASGLPWRQS